MDWSIHTFHKEDYTILAHVFLSNCFFSYDILTYNETIAPRVWLANKLSSKLSLSRDALRIKIAPKVPSPNQQQMMLKKRKSARAFKFFSLQRLLFLITLKCSLKSDYAKMAPSYSAALPQVYSEQYQNLLTLVKKIWFYCFLTTISQEEPAQLWENELTYFSALCLINRIVN